MPCGAGRNFLQHIVYRCRWYRPGFWHFHIKPGRSYTVNQKMIETAQTVVILADSTKFDRRGLGRICSLEQVQYIITDNNVSKSTVKAIEEKGIKVIIA
jgi:DeoR/GlpR family transcriptional regulator of sugar metabolism